MGVIVGFFATLTPRGKPNQNPKEYRVIVVKPKHVYQAFYSIIQRACLPTGYLVTYCACPPTYQASHYPPRMSFYRASHHPPPTHQPSHYLVHVLPPTGHFIITAYILLPGISSPIVLVPLQAFLIFNTVYLLSEVTYPELPKIMLHTGISTAWPLPKHVTYTLPTKYTDGT